MTLLTTIQIQSEFKFKTLKKEILAILILDMQDLEKRWSTFHNSFFD